MWIYEHLPYTWNIFRNFTGYCFWIKPLRIISSSENSVNLAVSNEFTKGIIKQRYESLLISTLKEIAENKYYIEYDIAE